MTWEDAVLWLRAQSWQQELVRQCYYDDPVAKAAERFCQSEEWQEIHTLLSAHMPGQVLDLGAGRGITTYAFAKRGCLVTALEPDPSPVVGSKAIRSLLDSAGLNGVVVEEYGETLPFADDKFDIVFGRAVLHHAHDLEKLCREAARVLRPGGIFMATREHVISKQEDLPEFLAQHALHSLYGGENAYPLNRYTHAIANTGLRLVRVIGPFDSVINYAPLSNEQHLHMLRSRLARLFGTRFADRLASCGYIRTCTSKIMSASSNVPGRHYSFMAIKK